MILPIKQFDGLRKDGDSTDSPPIGARALTNLDIDPTRTRLRLRRPYRVYGKLSSVQFPDGSLPNPSGFYPYWVLLYDVGVSTVQRNTILVYRGGTTQAPIWRIYDNAPVGGDGNPWIFIAEEQSSHCFPIAVAGKVRFYLGNEEPFKIWMPFDWSGSKNKAFYADSQTALLSEVDIRNNVEAYQQGRAFREGESEAIDTGGASVTITNDYLYLEGRPYTVYDVLNYKSLVSSFAAASTNVTPNAGFNPLPKGDYELVVACFLDDFPQQLSAPIFKGKVRINRGPEATDIPVIGGILQVGGKYRVNDVRPYFWRQGSNGKWFFSSNLAVGSQGLGTYLGKFDVYYNGALVKPGVALTTSGATSFDKIQLVTPDVSYTLDGIKNHAGTSIKEAGGPQEVLYYGNDLTPLESFPCYAVQGIVNPTFNTNDPFLFDFSTVPADVLSDMLVQGAVAKDSAGNYYGVSGKVWQLSHTQPLIEPIGSIQGEYLAYDFSIDTEYVNPRITHIGVFLKAVVDGTFAEDHTLLAKLPVYKHDLTKAESLGTSAAVVGSRNIISINGIITEKNVNTSYGFWSALAGTGDGGFRPVDHLESDITRKLGVVAYRKGRFFGALIDDDPGQEIVAYTPLADGQDNLDIWFRPLYLAKGTGAANTWLTEWQDRLLIFQKNNLHFAGLDDKNDRFFQNFAYVGAGVGTHIVKSIAKSKNALFFFNYDGIYKFNGTVPVDITKGSIHDFWKHEVSPLQKDLAFGACNNKTNEYWVVIPGEPGVGQQRITNPYVDPLPWEDYVNSIENIGMWKNFIILIWNDDDETGRYWRVYETFNRTSGSDDRPSVCFSDRENTWVFGTHEKKLYYWEDEQSLENGLDKGNIPVYFRWSSQHLGERQGNIIPNKIQVIGEPEPSTDIKVKVNRNEQDQLEEITMLSGRRDRKRRLERRRSNTVQLEIEGEYSDDATPANPVEIREIVFEYLTDTKKPD